MTWPKKYTVELVEGTIDAFRDSVRAIVAHTGAAPVDVVQTLINIAKSDEPHPRRVWQTLKDLADGS